jgi:hypothetical protein
LRAARELGPAVFVDGDEIWNTERMTTDEEWIAFAGFLRPWSGGSAYRSLRKIDKQG